MIHYRAEDYVNGAEGAIGHMGRDLLNHGEPVDTGHWQALKDVPQTNTIENRSVLFEMEIPDNSITLLGAVSPNMPWAEDHFQERVSGEPLNPGEQYKNWPWYKGNVETHKPQGQFSHTYMERYWPKWANSALPGSKPYSGPRRGIRYEYGDLNDVVSLLVREPTTRQAYLPVWFPEDTGAVHGERVPCSLGYHFMQRNRKLHCWYHMRSCDFLRYFRDDVYLTCRLVQWVCKQAGAEIGIHELWAPGTLTMMIGSLHVFEGDLPQMRRLYG